ncbi:MAG: type II toxin-antitoxin system RelE/ParE family toxin [Clostridium tyrobutyricum]|jgi:phage-related protein|uniref:type II toxin-antitoxin system RelE/ParE family toxin n=1 Tax=Clostridium tyrobutyricum TaxID=1519 RepID=UPI00242A7A45|nr:type II toxin-antitoxin system RelE/ParE family toxin [Clostridium tyrobutyricum]MCH4200558.1 type II toxin-antitoxin system RelE/ParE family toxin [Clostridium tyrobutyricum]MCH4237594.1 type II toxin-antitoxin system RelE/ParE family toxin [Clostridium tyrobutyricum]MCH4259695.1 type II toxin-antitoxin system RelE/ParE family toxin [Clostridium tyrobutyricum]
MNIWDYETSGGKDLINGYLDNLPCDESAEGYRIKQLLEDEGLKALDLLDTRQLRSKLWEIKFNYKDRFMYVVADKNNFYILHACKKQKGKAEKIELDKAIKRAKELGRCLNKKFV